MGMISFRHTRAEDDAKRAKEALPSPVEKEEVDYEEQPDNVIDEETGVENTPRRRGGRRGNTSGDTE